jgi:hypothetical protein
MGLAIFPHFPVFSVMRVYSINRKSGLFRKRDAKKVTRGARFYAQGIYFRIYY